MTIGVFGAGAIGTYVGGKLLVAGHDVVLVGRLGEQIAQHGVELSDLDGAHHKLEPSQVPYSDQLDTLADCDVILVAVKSPATEKAARQLATVIRSDAVVVSLQNGVGNAEVLRSQLGDRSVLSGMVPFNVVRQEPSGFHRATAGDMVIERAGGAGEPIARAFVEAGIPTLVRDDMTSVLWAKLLLNLNNSLNALAGVPLVEELTDATYRRILSDLQREALQVMRTARIKPARLGKVLPKMVPWVLRLPGPVFRWVSKSMFAIDPTARSSMWEDLERGRKTEIDYINGAVVDLAERHGTDAPMNRALVELVRKAEQNAAGSPGLDAHTLSEALSVRAGSPSET